MLDQTPTEAERSVGQSRRHAISTSSCRSDAPGRPALAAACHRWGVGQPASAISVKMEWNGDGAVLPRVVPRLGVSGPVLVQVAGVREGVLLEALKETHFGG